MKEFKHLDFPRLREYYTKYPQGYTIYESLLEILEHINEMTDVVNLTLKEWEKIETWVLNELKKYSIDQLQTWLDDGTLEELINLDIFNEKVNRSEFNSLSNSLTNIVNTSVQSMEDKVQVAVKQLSTPLRDVVNTKVDSDSIINVLNLSDSTSNSNNEWFRLFANKFTSELDYNIDYQQWNDNTKSYTPEILKRSGTEPQANLIYLNGGLISSPHRPEQVITGSFELQMRFSLKSVTDKIIVSKFGQAGERGWAFGTTGNGTLYFWHSSDGTTNSTINLNVDLDAGVEYYLKFKVLANNGSGQNVIYVENSVDGGLTFTPFPSSPITTNGVLSLYPTTFPLNIFGRGGTTYGEGTFYEMALRNGIGGPIVCYPRILNTQTNVSDSINSYTVTGPHQFKVTGRLLQFFNGSQSGATMSYVDSNFSNLVPVKPNLCFISLSHNEQKVLNINSGIQSLIDKVKAVNSECLFIIVGQNPQTENDPNWYEHGVRVGNLTTYAVLNQYPIINVFSAFKLNPNWRTELMSDNVHPNEEGSKLWATLTGKLFNLT